MALLKALSGLKSVQLKHAAFLMGLRIAGTKSEIESEIRHRIAASQAVQTPPRIVSVDMGIKNLGICVLEAPNLVDARQNSMSKRPAATQLKVLAWEKVDVLSLLTPGSEELADAVATTDNTASSKGRRQRKATAQPIIAATAFSPSSLSTAALSITSDIISTYSPTHILIERQRFRSGGAAAVQEWTLRVNMLESMIWACLETMRQISRGHGAGSFPAAHEVSPARVARFWCSGPSATGLTVPQDLFDEDWKASDVTSELVSSGKRKIEKKDKIAVVRSWLSQKRDLKTKESGVLLDFADEAQVVANSFFTETKRGKKQNENGTGKLDDLADCLLQGAAWVQWERNQRIIRDMLEKSST